MAGFQHTQRLGCVSDQFPAEPDLDALMAWLDAGRTGIGPDGLGMRVKAFLHERIPSLGAGVRAVIVVVTARIWGRAGTEEKPKRTGGLTGASGPRSSPFHVHRAEDSRRMERTP